MARHTFGGDEVWVTAYRVKVMQAAFPDRPYYNGPYLDKGSAKRQATRLRTARWINPDNIITVEEAQLEWHESI